MHVSRATWAAGLSAAVAAFVWPRLREEGVEDYANFMQTGVRYASSAGRLNATHGLNAAHGHADLEPELCPIHYMPLPQRILKGSLEYLGYDPAVERQAPCRPLGSSLSSGNGIRGWELFGASLTTGSNYVILIPIIFVGVYTVVLLRMLVNILFLAPSKAASRRSSAADGRGGLRRFEQESWNAGLVNWLCVDWANEWIARWGNSENSDQTMIEADDLGGIGDDEDEPVVCHYRIKKLWDEEVMRRGLNNASLIMVMIRFITYRRLFVLSVWTAGYESVMYLGPPLVMDWTVQFFEYIYVRRLQGEVVDQSEFAVPSIILIAFFAGLPIFMVVCNTMSSLMSQRIAIRVCGGLSALCFEKAQRLPMSTHDQQSDGKTPGAPGAAPEKQADGKQPAEAEGDLSDDDDESKQGWWVPKRYNLVQVVANDVNGNVLMIPVYLSKVALQIPVLMILLFTLWSKIRWTLCLTFLVAFVVGFLILRNAIKVTVSMLCFFNYASDRLQLLQNVLFSIRTSKACGWEDIVADSIQEKRVREMKELEAFYSATGWFYHWMFTLPKALVCVSIWGHSWLYPDSALNIFAMLPGLLTMQSATMALISGVPTLLQGKASLMRAEGYLKQQEGPTGRPKVQGTPPWLTLWPSARAGGPQGAPGGDVAGPQGGTLRIQGNFAREEDGVPVLRGLDISVPAGGSLAILGHVGSGKSTFLHAMLGELYPAGDARLEISEIVAYSSQVPYICEGTLRDNVLFGESVDKQVYQTSIFSAGLVPDIALFPGGEDVEIGSRGITLSGGQKARVSMARVACNRNAPVVLIDDPFSALDSQTARHVLTHLVHGEGLEGRTRIIVTQPDRERIVHFDQVVIMSDGRVVAQGTPEEVMQTPEYSCLLSSRQVEALGEEAPQAAAVDAHFSHRKDTPQAPKAAKSTADEAYQLRDEEFQGRVNWETVHYFFKIGWYPYITVCIVMYLVMTIFNLLMNMVLQDWSTEQVSYQAGVLDHDPRSVLQYFWGYMFWWIGSITTWFISWTAGTLFTLRLSGVCHMSLVKRLLRAPVDRFFDKTPVGRIMNRMSTDLQNVDLATFNKITMFIGMVWTFGVPLTYVHMLLPMYFTIASLPFYFLMVCLIRRFWLTMVPMRYLTSVCKSKTDAYLTEVEYSNPIVRGLQKSEFSLSLFVVELGRLLKTDVNTRTVLLRWVQSRLLFMVGFYTTCIALLALWVPDLIDFGGVGLCLSNMLTILTSTEIYIDITTTTQFQFISMNRLYEYTELIEEKPAYLPEDTRYASITATIRRAALKGVAHCRNSEGLVVVCRSGKTPGASLLVQAPQGEALVAGPCQSLRSLDPDCAKLQETEGWHRIVAANGVRGSAEAIAKEIATGESEEITLDLQSGWLVGGAEVVIEDLRVGYGDIPKDVLRDVSIIIQPRSKAGIVGTTGCGKSTLMLSLLRILEPRGGAIYINKVNTQHLGLHVLRHTIGLVPQDPVVLEGTVRSNLDPFGLFSDADLWRGLGMVELERLVRGMPGGLDSHLPVDGGNLSFGQRQLLCLGRVVVRQPALILLDEATSALDPHTQEVVNTTIKAHFPDSTLLVIAHRLETIMDFDLIVVMRSGEVVEKGCAKDLKDVQGGFFAKMLLAKNTW